MAEKKGRSSRKGAVRDLDHVCPSCGSDSRVMLFTGFGMKGYFWVCEKECGYRVRTR